MTELATIGQNLPTIHSGATAAAQHAMAQVQAKSLVALSRPRDFNVVRLRMLGDCKRPLFAENCRYDIPNRGSGWNIRFAESVIRNFGNVDCEAITVDDNEEALTVRVSVSDLETNASLSRDVTVEKTVERRKKPKNEDQILSTRYNSYGDEIYVLRATSEDSLGKINSAVSKATRTLILKLVPFDLLMECEEQVKQTMRNRDAEDPDAAKNRLVDAFATLGVTPSDLTEYLGKSLARLQPADMTLLKGVYGGLRDGVVTWEECMEDRHPPQTAEGVTNAMDEKAPEPEADNFGLGEPERPKTKAPKGKKGPDRSKLLGEIAGLGLSDIDILQQASVVVGKAVMDLADLTDGNLVQLLPKLKKMV